MFEALGYASLEDFVRRGLEIDPQVVDWASTGLRTLDPTQPAPLDVAVTAGKRAQQLAAQAVPIGKHGKAERDARGCFAPPIQGAVNTLDQATQRGSTNALYLTSRIARDAPDVLARMKAGEFPSVRAAARAAGILRERSRVERGRSRCAAS